MRARLAGGIQEDRDAGLSLQAAPSTAAPRLSPPHQPRIDPECSRVARPLSSPPSRSAGAPTSPHLAKRGLSVDRALRPRDPGRGRPRGILSSRRPRPKELCAAARSPRGHVRAGELEPPLHVSGARPVQQDRQRTPPHRPPRSAGSARPQPGEGIDRQVARARAASGTGRAARRRSTARNTVASSRDSGRALRQRLGAEETRERVKRRADRREEDEALDAGPLGGAHEPERGHRVELLDRGPGLVADRGGEVDHGVHAAQRVAEEAGSARSPSAICTRTRSGPGARGSRTRQRTGSPAAGRRRSSAAPTSRWLRSEGSRGAVASAEAPGLGPDSHRSAALPSARTRSCQGARLTWPT